jgi:hypothetical protein
MAVPVETKTSAPALTAQDLLERSPAQLDALFRDAPAGPIPTGRGAGTVILLPGTAVAKPAARVLGRIFWQGKVFRPERGDLRNLVSPFGVQAIRAEVSRDESWVDAAECVLIDYSRSSRVAGWIRDEIREVAPGVYLGVVWGVGRLFDGRRRLLRFALSFPDRSA